MAVLSTSVGASDDCTSVSLQKPDFAEVEVGAEVEPHTSVEVDVNWHRRILQGRQDRRKGVKQIAGGHKVCKSQRKLKGITGRSASTNRCQIGKHVCRESSHLGDLFPLSQLGHFKAISLDREVKEAGTKQIRHVTFNLELNTVHEITPYSEVYGVHPRHVTSAKSQESSAWCFMAPPSAESDHESDSSSDEEEQPCIIRRCDHKHATSSFGKEIPQEIHDPIVRAFMSLGLSVANASTKTEENGEQISQASNSLGPLVNLDCYVGCHAAECHDKHDGDDDAADDEEEGTYAHSLKSLRLGMRGQ